VISLLGPTPALLTGIGTTGAITGVRYGTWALARLFVSLMSTLPVVGVGSVFSHSLIWAQ
jgi:hypothetical protein